MKLHSCGLWIPDVLTGPSAYLQRAHGLEVILPRVRSRRSCIQAGGHVGIYPRRLAIEFGNVYTFEPEHENFACLVANVAQLSNVYCYRAFLGDAREPRHLLRHEKSSGGHHTGAIGGPIPVMRIDDLGLRDVDAILLDVEGFELQALMGALVTLQKCKPLVVVEENKQMHRHGRRPGDIDRVLATLGYKRTMHVDEDIVLEVEWPAKS